MGSVPSSKGPEKAPLSLLPCEGTARSQRTLTLVHERDLGPELSQAAQTHRVLGFEVSFRSGQEE